MAHFIMVKCIEMAKKEESTLLWPDFYLLMRGLEV